VRTSNGYTNGKTEGTGTLTLAGPTGWYTGDLLLTGDVGRNHLALGINANLYETDQSQYATTSWRAATGQIFQNRAFGKSRQIGLFAEDEIAFTDSLSLMAGIRADFWRAFGGGMEQTISGSRAASTYASRSDSAISPTLSLAWAVAPDWNAQLSLAMATRFPTVGELFQGSLTGDGQFDPASFDPDLKPEKSHDANLIIRHDGGKVAITGSLFYQHVKDTLFRFTGLLNSGATFTRNFNIDRTRQYGMELIAEAKNWPIEGMDGNLAWIDSTITRNDADPTTEGHQFPRIPRWRLSGNVRYHVTPAILTSLGMRYASRPNSDLNGLQRGDTYGYASEFFALDARVAWNVSNKVTLSAGVDNISNDRAWVYHPYPQRTFLIEAGWRL
jgi:iron complex outermembrane receptor protein